jgi:hypothetical protein
VILVPDLAWWMKNFKASAFRLETLPVYDSPRETEMLAAFMRDEEVSLPDDFAWLQMVRSHTAAGRSMQRVRMVQYPLSDYIRFEMSLYPQCVEAGEEIRIWEGDGSLLGSPKDFWLFDRATCFELHYDSRGAFLGAEPVEATYNRQRMRLALQWSIPLANYTARATR